jgi:hypothetical protein
MKLSNHTLSLIKSQFQSIEVVQTRDYDHSIKVIRPVSIMTPIA